MKLRRATEKSHLVALAGRGEGKGRQAYGHREDDAIGFNYLHGTESLLSSH
jgi:hypothetical protein